MVLYQMNLLFKKKYKTADDYHGFNPEHIDGGNPRAYGSQRAGTPIYQTISFGMNIDF